MAKAVNVVANVCTILAFIIGIPIAYKQLYPTGGLSSLPDHWPLILLCVAFGGGAILQVIAAILNRKSPKTEPLQNDGVDALKNELNKVYGDCIYDWAAANQQNAPFSADQLAHYLNLSREKIDAGIAHLNSVNVLERAGFGWRIDPCRPLNPDFKRAPQWIVV